MVMRTAYKYTWAPRDGEQASKKGIVVVCLEVVVVLLE
jgi:hypothetical protein